MSDPAEAWIFHILPDPTGESAIWAAQRVNDEHFAVMANMFVIRQVGYIVLFALNCLPSTKTTCLSSPEGGPG